MSLSDEERWASDLALRCAERDYVRIARTGPLEAAASYQGKLWLINVTETAVKAVRDAYRARHGVSLPRWYLHNLVYEDARRDKVR